MTTTEPSIFVVDCKRLWDPPELSSEVVVEIFVVLVLVSSHIPIGSNARWKNSLVDG